jgi:hypothetical protein
MPVKLPADFVPARWSPSTLDRIQACPGSYVLSSFPTPVKGTPRARSASAFGTDCHRVAEHCIGSWTPPLMLLGKTLRLNGRDVEISQDIVAAVELVYDYVESRDLGYYFAWDEPAIIECEVPCVLQSRFPTLRLTATGKADVVIQYPHMSEMEIIDFKTGSSPAAPDSAQLMSYALAILNAPDTRGVDTILLTIVQPDTDPAIRTVELTAVELQEFGGDLERLQLRIQEAFNSLSGNVVDSEWSRQFLNATEKCNFCPASATCRLLAEDAMEEVNILFRDETRSLQSPPDPSSMTDADLASVMSNKKGVMSWFDTVEKEALKRLSAGGEIEGYELVPKQSSRRWKDADEDTLKRMAELASTTVDILTETRIKPAATLEKALGCRLEKLSEFLIPEKGGWKVGPTEPQETNARKRMFADIV